MELPSTAAERYALRFGGPRGCDIVININKISGATGALMSTIDFLKPDTEQIRHQIRGILDSYSHDWDLLSELAQNCIDAIRDAEVEERENQAAHKCCC